MQKQFHQQVRVYIYICQRDNESSKLLQDATSKSTVEEGRERERERESRKMEASRASRGLLVGRVQCTPKSLGTERNRERERRETMEAPRFWHDAAFSEQKRRGEEVC